MRTIEFREVTPPAEGNSHGMGNQWELVVNGRLTGGPMADGGIAEMAEMLSRALLELDNQTDPDY